MFPKTIGNPEDLQGNLGLLFAPLNLFVCPLCAASHLFPYVKKRIQVISQSSTELNPIEVAIDEMSRKVSELNQLCTTEEVDMIRLQLKLQGSVSVKVSKQPPELRFTQPVKLAIQRLGNLLYIIFLL